MARPQQCTPRIVSSSLPAQMTIAPDVIQYYRDVVQALDDHDVPFLVGGAYALAEYTGIVRHTKDFDVFVVRSDRNRALEAVATVSQRTEVTWPHWLAKAYRDELYVDVIYNSSNGLARVDDAWFTNAVPTTIFGIPVKLAPPEEILWQKAFIMDRERYDGSDVAHLLRAQATNLDWNHLLDRFGEHWRVLYSHLVLFGFIYPDHRLSVPPWVIETLSNRLNARQHEPAPCSKVCRGTLLSRLQYLIDVTKWDYRDARLWPKQLLSIFDLVRWTNGIAEKDH